MCWYNLSTKKQYLAFQSDSGELGVNHCFLFASLSQSQSFERDTMELLNSLIPILEFHFDYE